MKQISPLLLLLLLWPMAAFALFGSSDDLDRCKDDKVALELKNKYCYKDKVAAETELAQLKTQYANEKAGFLDKIADLEGQLEKLRGEFALLDKTSKREKKDLKTRIAELQKTINTLKAKSSNKEQQLLSENQKLQKRIEKELGQLKGENKKLQADHLAALAALKALHDEEISKRDESIRNLEEEMASLKKLSKDQQNELDRMKSQGKELEKKLSSEIKKGEIRLKRFSNKLVINLDDKISFASGSPKLKPGVKKALGKIRDILSNYPENNIMVEGHTDNIPLKGGRNKDNWHLSSQRALSVLRFLLDKKGVDPGRFAAVGYGEHHPLVSNDTKENRSLNRRVDIVVIPRIQN